MAVEVRSARAAQWTVVGKTLDLSEPRVMGILNITPDSFSDGGELTGVESALERAAAMVRAGAAILDVGGESTRPGASDVPVDEEIARVVPVVEAVAARFDVPVSIDTRKSAVALAALDAGAALVNDVSGLRHDPRIAGVVAERGAGLVLMHMRGDPRTMGDEAEYADLMGEITEELRTSIDIARRAGVGDEQLVVDPGIGFAKTSEQSLLLLRDLPRMLELGRPILIGPSRKSFLGRLLDVDVHERLAGTVAACVLGYLGGARIFRVHDVGAVAQALTVARSVT